MEDTTHVSAGQAFLDLERLLGVEVSLDVFHGTLRRAAQAMHPRGEVGTMLVTCSDEFLGEVRTAFARDVARPLTALQMIGSRGTFAVANLGGRFEPGALALADEHFSGGSRPDSARRLVVELVAHVGRLRQDHSSTHGLVDRFGKASPCCGALTLLLEAPEATAAVRHPWFDQLSAFFGPARLSQLRADPSPWRLVRAAIVHAVLQGESAMADLLRDPPDGPAHILLACVVAINQPGTDGALLASVQRMHFDGTHMHLEHAAALRSSPEALDISSQAGRLLVSFAEQHDQPRVVPVARTRAEVHEDLHALTAGLERLAQPHERAKVHEHLTRIQRQVAHAKKKPSTWRIYSRPLLRGLVQGLSIVAPELGLAAFALQAGTDAVKAQHVRKLLREGPKRDQARQVLHQLEAELQQLSHREAQEVLDVLVAENSPLWKH